MRRQKKRRPAIGFPATGANAMSGTQHAINTTTTPSVSNAQHPRQAHSAAACPVCAHALALPLAVLTASGQLVHLRCMPFGHGGRGGVA